MRRRLSQLSISCDFVLDCSMTIAWFFRDESTAYTDSVLRGLGRGKALVPALWSFEVAKTLLIGWKRQRCSWKEMQKWIKLIGQLSIACAPMESQRMMSDWLSLAMKHQVTVYDASYLMLAWETGLPIASLDDKVNDVAIKLGIERYDPDSILT